MAKRKTGTEGPDINQIKKWVVMGMFSDDKLMQRLVLKGGNAMALIYGMDMRASLDIDLSMADAFKNEELETVRKTIEYNLQKTFRAERYEVFDVTMEKKPEVVTPEQAGFWGGYAVAFKVIEKARHEEFKGDLDRLRRNAIRIGSKGKFEIDISGFEYCEPKKAEQIDGVRVFVYSPPMLVCEKLRAICQQMPDYGPIVRRERVGVARARDFVDIHALVEGFRLDVSSPENRGLMGHIFGAKRVPLALLRQISQTREFHRTDFVQVENTVNPGIALKTFDFYFDFVVKLCESLGNV